MTPNISNALGSTTSSKFHWTMVTSINEWAF
uniref:Uncharacterized protein n=1 Tax=Heterorhabditis bacteriophora TaxID=37862 RepID=A0A1I7XKF3_HETBA